MGISRLKFELVEGEQHKRPVPDRSKSQEQLKEQMPGHHMGSEENNQAIAIEDPAQTLDQKARNGDRPERFLPVSGSGRSLPASDECGFVWPGSAGATALSSTSLASRSREQALTVAERSRSKSWSAPRIEPLQSRTKSAGNGSAPTALDGGLLSDLAAGLEYLSHELQDSESELDQIRKQSAAFEQRGLDLESLAHRRQGELDSLQEQLSDLRQALDRSNHDSHNQQASQRESLARLSSEMADLQAARTQLEQVAAEQQRALILSLEVVRRLDTQKQNPHEPPPELIQASPELIQARANVLELRQQLEAIKSTAPAQVVFLEDELARQRSEIQAFEEASAKGEHAATQSREEAERANQKITFLEDELARFREELTQLQEAQAPTAELEALQVKLEAESFERAALDRELAVARAELSRSQNSPSDLPQFELLQKAEREREAALKQAQAYEAEVALQTAEVESRGAIITALENSLEEQNSALRTLEERFLAYAEQVQSLQLERLEMPGAQTKTKSWFGSLFSPAPKS